MALDPKKLKQVVGEAMKKRANAALTPEEREQVTITVKADGSLSVVGPDALVKKAQNAALQK